jgi:LDH2 family malate/lactate/ureidoglycolate dehydrogenase
MYVPGELRADVGHALIAIRISAFLERSEYQRRYSTWYDALKASQPAQGHDAILIPGERSAAIARKQQREGIYLDAKTWQSLDQLAEKLGVALCTDLCRLPVAARADKPDAARQELPNRYDARGRCSENH